MRINITTNLESALRALRHPAQPRTLWIDAVCINQDDPFEKPQQLLEMGEIYRNARQVVIWLGDGNERTDIMFRTINSDGWDGSIQRGLEDFFEDGLADVLSRAWWRRVWVVQEMAMGAQDPLIVCGERCMSWAKFISQVRGNKLPLDRLLSERLHILGMDDMRAQVRIPPRLRDYSAVNDNILLLEDDLLQWLRRTTEFESSRPHDKLFALLGLTRSPRSKQVTVNYNLGFMTVMKALVTHQVNAHHSLSILTLCHPQRSTAYVSWVPDLSVSGPPGLPALDMRLASNHHSCDPRYSWYSEVLAYPCGVQGDERDFTGSTCSISFTALHATGIVLGRVNHLCLRNTGEVFDLDQASSAASCSFPLLGWPPDDRIPALLALRQHMQGKDLLAPAVDLDRLCDTSVETQNMFNTIFDDAWFDERASDLDAAMSAAGRPRDMREKPRQSANSSELEALHRERTQSVMGETLELELLAKSALDACPHDPWDEIAVFQHMYHREIAKATGYFHWRPLWSKMAPKAVAKDQKRQDSLLRIRSVTQAITVNVEDQSHIDHAMSGRVQFTTDTGLLGVGPSDVHENDQTVLFRDSPFAFAIRTEGWRQVLVGQVFVAPPQPPEVEKDFGERPTNYPADWKEPVEETFVIH